MNISYKTRTAILGLAAMAALPMTTPAHASGMVPETSVIILEVAEGEASINVTNTDTLPSLLHSAVVNLPHDPEAIVLVSPPVARVEAGDKQLVRFMLNTKEDIPVQRLKRVIFEGIPQRPKSESSATLGVTVRQNLPMIIHPKGLARNAEPWKLLKWYAEGDKLTVVNDSAYVTRLAQSVLLKKDGAADQSATVELPTTYVLPGQTLSISGAVAGTTSVVISPATVYGYQVDTYEAPITAGPAPAAAPGSESAVDDGAATGDASRNPGTEADAAGS